MSIKFDSTSKTPLTEGGEGVIFEVNGKIIKVYKPVVNMISKRNKIKLLMSKSLPAAVVKPLDEVVDRKGKFIGFAMKKVEGDELKCLSNNKFMKANGFTDKDVLQILVKIWKTIIELHNKGIYIGDLNDQNILFDKQLNVYFIDCDSWTVESEKCEVAMDLFKDPLLHANDFNENTDTYSFAVLAWKTMTRIHPFGGTMNPDMNILDRMKKGISVIDNPKVKVPRTIKSWRNLSPDLIAALQNIFETNCRTLGNELEDMMSNLKYCDKDKVYYYGKYSVCPICDMSAKIQKKPISQGVVGGLNLFEVLDALKIKAVFDENTYLDKNDYIVDVRSGRKVKYQYGNKYYFVSCCYVVEDTTDSFIIHAEKDYYIEKKYKSRIVVEGEHIYYISRQNSFIDMTVMKVGNSIKNICKCSSVSYFEVKDGNYCIVNVYADILIVNMNGKNIEIKYNSDIINYGIHYDIVSGRWLIVFENSKGIFNTYIIKNGMIDYQTDQIKYTCGLGSLCISNAIIFIPVDGKIRGYSYQKSAFKDFECPIVNESSTLIKNKNKFIIVNDENIYNFG